jgi:hypothetical protein
MRCYSWDPFFQEVKIRRALYLRLLWVAPR